MCAWRRRPPQYNEVAVILLGAVGAVIGLEFGHTVITEDASSLGSLKEYRLAMILGALAVFWTASESLIGVFGNLVRASARNHEQSRSSATGLSATEKAETAGSQNTATPAGPTPPLRGSAGR